METLEKETLQKEFYQRVNEKIAIASEASNKTPVVKPNFANHKLNSLSPEDRIKEYLKEHSISRDVGNTVQACSIASINLALGNGLTEDVPETVSPVITHWLMLSQDIMSQSIRDKQLKELLPKLLDTDVGEAAENKRVKILRYWVFNVLCKKMEEQMDEIGVLPEFKRAIKLKSKKAFITVEKKLGSNSYAYGEFIKLLSIIATEKDNIIVARKVSMIMGYMRDSSMETIKLLKKMIKVK